MRYLKKIYSSLLILSMMVMMVGQTAFAAEEEYTYTVRLYAGNQGVLTGTGVSVSGGGSISYGRDEIVIRGLKYDDVVYITPQEAANVTDERYYVKGVRRSGRDNSEAVEASFRVACDRDYVIAYGIVGDMAAYRVNYLDEDGNSLLPSNTYYGPIGERQYVSARYVDGYQPDVLNLVKTLSDNEAENVFDFRYTAVSTGTETPGTTTTLPGTVTVTETGGGTETTEVVTGGGAGAGAATGGAGAAGAGGADADAAGADGADADEAADAGVDDAAADAGDAVGGDVVSSPDENVPQSNLQNLDGDEEVPLAIGPDQAGTRMGYLPVYIGISAVAMLTLLVTAIGLKRRQKARIAGLDDRKEP